MAVKRGYIELVSKTLDNTLSDSFSEDAFMASDNSPMIKSENETQEAASLYWLGKKCFDYILAKEVYRQYVADSIGTLDALQEQSMREYPCEQTLKELRSHGLVDNRNDHERIENEFEDLMVAVGAILARDNAPSQDVLEAGLQRFAMGTGVPATPSASTFTAQNQLAPLRSLAAPSDMAYYISILKEYSDKTGSIVKYEINPISLRPLIFEAVLTYEGVTLAARSCSKKSAKHLVSKQACDQLDLRPARLATYILEILASCGLID